MRHPKFLMCIGLALVVTVGCNTKGGIGSSSAVQNGNTTTNNGYPPITTPDSTSGTLSTGATIPLDNVDLETLSDYAGKAFGSPTNLEVNVSLKRFGTYSRAGGGYDYGFGGKVTIRFKEGGTQYADSFSSMLISGSNQKTNAENHVYNLLTSDYPELAGRVGYHGFFETTGITRGVPPCPPGVCLPATQLGGSIVLVINQTNDSGDGQGPTLANGAVYYRNYISQYPMGPIPYTNCWFINTGPYDCRAWASGSGVSTKASIWPNRGYIRLGSFTGLDIKKAFNNEI